LLNLIRPYQGYNTILDEATVFIANYNALQANLTASFGNHNLIGINYTWSRGLTTSEADTGVAPQNSYDIPAEYGLTAFDRRHVFTAHFVYNLPIYNKQIGWTGHILGGWEISGIVTFAAGLPLTPITSSVDPAGQGALSPTSPELTRPDVNSNPNADAPHTLSQWFVPSHFTAVPAGIGRPGNSPNGIVRGPGYQVWNLDLSKNIQLPNNLRLQLRGEAFNAWNHVNWNTVDMYFIDSTFGQVTADRDPRQLQVGVKLIY